MPSIVYRSLLRLAVGKAIDFDKVTATKMDKLPDELLATADVGDSKKKKVPRPQTRAHTRARSSPVSAPGHLTPKSPPRRVKSRGKVAVAIRSRAPSKEQRLIKSPTRDGGGGGGKWAPAKSRDDRREGQRPTSPVIEFRVVRVVTPAKTGEGGGKRAPAAKTRDDRGRGQRPASRAKTRGGGGGKRAPAKSPTTPAGKGASRNKPRTKH